MALTAPSYGNHGPFLDGGQRGGGGQMVLAPSVAHPRRMLTPTDVGHRGRGSPTSRVGGGGGEVFPKMTVLPLPDGTVGEL